MQKERHPSNRSVSASRGTSLKKIIGAKTASFSLGKYQPTVAFVPIAARKTESSQNKNQPSVVSHCLYITSIGYEDGQLLILPSVIMEEIGALSNLIPMPIY